MNFRVRFYFPIGSFVNLALKLKDRKATVEQQMQRKNKIANQLKCFGSQRNKCESKTKQNEKKKVENGKHINQQQLIEFHFGIQTDSTEFEHRTESVTLSSRHTHIKLRYFGF